MTRLKELSRNRKRRISRRNKISYDLKLILNKIKSEKKNKNKNVDKIAELEILLVGIRYADNPNKSESALGELKEIQGIDKNLHEIKNEILLDYAGALEMVRNIEVRDQIRQTNTRLREMEDFETYINAIDQDYDSEDAFFNGYIYKLDTP